VSQSLSSAEQSSLVERLRSGDADAEAEFARLFSGRLRMMLAVRIHDSEMARDLAQEALVAALTALRSGALRDAERLGAFVYGVGRNVANNYLRRQQGAPVLVPLDPDDVIDTGRPDNLEDQERRLLAGRALGALAAGEREILMLTLVEGLKPGEIAARLELGVDVIRTRKSRALKKVVAEIQRLSRSAADRH
jgi:RNA polymerase sigma factor (sigma-70 family)